MNITELELTEGKRYETNEITWVVDQTSGLISEGNGCRLVDEFRLSHILSFDFKLLPDALSTEEKLSLAIKRIENLVIDVVDFSIPSGSTCCKWTYEKGMQCDRKITGVSGCDECRERYVEEETERRISEELEGLI